MNVTPITSAKAPFELAMYALWRNRKQSRSAALRTTITTLVEEHGIDEAAAEVAAIQAFADLDCVNETASIDVDASTSCAVIFRDSAGRPVMLTARDLSRFIEQARDAGIAHVVDADTRRPTVLEH